MIKLIIFDLDGVLVDSEIMHRESLLDAIKDITGMQRHEYEYLFKIDGRTTQEKLVALKEFTNLSDLDIQLIDDKKQQNLIRHLFRGFRTSPNLATMIEILSKKYKLCIASNSRKENVINILNIIGISGYFERIYSNNDVVNPKPAPDIFLRQIEEMNVPPNETLILEDSEAGCIAARASGAHLFEIDNLEQVTLENIENVIKRIDANNTNPHGGNGESLFTGRV